MFPLPSSRPLPPSRSASSSSATPTFGHTQRVSGTATTSIITPPYPSTPQLVTRNSMASLTAAQQAQSKAKSAAWMKKIRKWKSKDDGLWGCAGDFPADDRDVLQEEDEDYGVALDEAKQLPPLPTESYQLASVYDPSSSSDVTYSSGSGYSSIRSSYGSQHRGRASGIGGGEGSTRSSVHSVHSVRSAGITSPSSAARADRLAKEQEDALAAITSYMARSNAPAACSRHASPSFQSSPSLPSSPTRHEFPSSPVYSSTSTACGTIRPSDRKASLAYARQHPRTSTTASSIFSPTSAAPAYATPAAATCPPAGRPGMYRSPSTSSLRGPAPHGMTHGGASSTRPSATVGRQRAFSSAGEGGHGARRTMGREPMPALPLMHGLGLERVGEEKRGYGYI